MSIKRFKSAQQAINAKCKDCIYDELAGGTWREQTANCPSTNCELFEYHPLNKALKDEAKSAKIANMTPDELLQYNQRVAAAAERFAITRAK